MFAAVVDLRQWLLALVANRDLVIARHIRSLRPAPFSSDQWPDVFPQDRAPNIGAVKQIP